MASAHGRTAGTGSGGPARWFQCLELDFHVGCPVLAPVLAAGPKWEHRVAQNQTWDFSSLSLASALDYGSSHSSALRRGTAPAELLVDLPAGSKKNEWCGAAMAWFDSQ